VNACNTGGSHTVVAGDTDVEEVSGEATGAGSTPGSLGRPAEAAWGLETLCPDQMKSFRALESDIR
jgi:hypothetical protein